MKSRIFALGLVLASCLVPEIGCVSIGTDGDQPKLGTHVVDWRDEVIYQVLIDRFADSDLNNDYNVRPGDLARFQGGDWKGLEDHLDYLKTLGVTTMWISPVVKNVETDANVDSYHGYWAQDLTKLNPHFGDISDLRRLTAKAHDMGMKIVLDIVTNHMGQLFFYDMNLNGVPDDNYSGSGPLPFVNSNSPVLVESEYDPDFDPRGIQAFSAAGLVGRAPIIFIQNPSINRIPPEGILGTAAAYHGRGRILDYSIVNQRETGDFPGGLKDVATENEAVRAELIDKYVSWAEKVDLDGFRIDTVKHIEHDFWTEWGQKVRARLGPQGKNRFLMFGEAFDGDDVLLGSYTQPNMLDSVFYFSQHYSVFRDVFEYAHDPTQQKGTAQIQQLWDNRKVNYNTVAQPGGAGVAPSKLLVNFLDNHDVERFLSDEASKGDKPALQNALTLQMTEEGIPCLYYGTEQEFNGGNDPANREILWQTNFNQSTDTYQHYSKLARIRRQYPALRRGDTNVIWSSNHVAQEEDAGIIAYERTGGDAGSAYALVVLNTNDFQASSTSSGDAVMKTSLPGITLVDVLDPTQQTYTVGGDGTLRISMPKQSGKILIPQGTAPQGQ